MNTPTPRWPAGLAVVVLTGIIIYGNHGAGAATAYILLALLAILIWLGNRFAPRQL